MTALRLPRLLLLLMWLLGCASTAPVRQYIDNDTAAAITVASGAIVFARERTDLAVHAQDYVTITPVQVNRSGQRDLYLYCQLWSTIDRRIDKTIVPANSQLALLVEDRRVDLPNTGTDIRRLGFGHAPVENRTPATEVRVAAIDAEMLRFMINATELRIGVTAEGLTNYFLPWRDDRKRIDKFLQLIGAHN